MRIKHTQTKNKENRQIAHRIYNSISNNDRALYDITHRINTTKEINWENWAKLPFNDKERCYNETLTNKFLNLKSDNPPDKTLISCFPYVTKVAIEFNPNKSFQESISEYGHLESIEILVITRITQKINFISGTNMKKAFIFTPIETQGITIDVVEPLLITCDKLETLKYYGGVLNDRSINSLRKNPIKELYLNDVTIANMDLFRLFLSNSPTLRIIKLMNTEIPQMCFFSDKNQNISKIETLQLTLHESLKRHYVNISKCHNLKNLILTYTCLNELLTIYYYIIKLPHLRNITIENKLPPPTNETSITENELDNKYFSEWKTIFARHNIILSKRHINHQTKDSMEM